MGLDISYYRGAVFAPDAEVDDDGNPVDYERYTRVYINPDFADRADDLIDGGIYETESGDGFRAGSYGGYGRWRNDLAKLASYPERADEYHHTHAAGAFATNGGPFWEMINFSDCEGVIGPKTSAKLAADFATYQDMAWAHPDEWFRSQYARWRIAFEIAADGGFVDFH